MIRFLFLSFLITSCASYDQFRNITDEVEIPTQTYNADFTQTWKAVVDVMRRFSTSENNPEAGIIKTKWADNTVEVNFADSFGSTDRIKSARFKLIVNVSKGFQLGREVTQVSIQKKQLVEQDFLQGFREIPTDMIEEKTLLYRIGRLIEIEKKLEQIDQARQQEQIESF